MLSPIETLTLGFVPGITAAAVQALLATDLPFHHITSLPDEELAHLGLKRKAITAIHDCSPYRDAAEEQMQLAQKHGTTIITINHPDYPERLRQIWSPPIALFVNGELAGTTSTSIAIVGTRNGTIYGRLSAEKYASACARSGVTVVSGLARGIDTWAHKATLESGGKTVAVVASGLDMIQPYTANRLATSIVEQGCVISEYPFGTKALRPYFPQRNRIISGLTVATLVVESDRKGGGMITAQFALDQDREVFALPGPVNSPKSNGTNWLIRTDRGRLTQTPDDLLELLGYRHSRPEEEIPPPANLSLFEQSVHDLLSEEPLHVDDLCEASGLSPSDLLVTLLTLEFKGLARQMAGKRFLRV